jgi:prephenate dehydratase
VAEAGPLGEVPRASFQGALGAFSEEAVRVLLPDAEPVPRATFDAVVRAVESGEDPYGVVAVENTLAGAVAEAYDALERGAVRVVAEVAIPIRHCLLGVPGATLAGVREARSHPVALAQCRAFFAAHPQIRAQAVFDTAGAAEEVARGKDPTVAAIASRGAGHRYGLEVLAEDLQDRADNQTRFYLIVRAEGADPGRATRAGYGSRAGPFKTACVAELENRPGALHGLLGVFASRGLDLSHVASRPSGSPWTYRFIVEFTHATEAEAADALEAAERLSTRLRVLGTFATRRGEEGGADVRQP